MPFKAFSFCPSVLLCTLIALATTHADPGLVAAWTFDSVSASGSTYFDVTGHGYNAVAAGTGLGLAPGIKGQALSCPQSGYDIDVLNSKDSFALASVTLEAWYYATTLSTYNLATIYELSYLVSGVHNGYNLFINPTGYPDFTIASGDQWIQCESPAAIAAGRWYHIVGSYDKSFSRLYVNGELKQSVACTGGIVYPVGQDARIGCQKLMGGTVQQFANGRIDELRLYNYALSADSVRAHYLRESPSSVILIPCVPNPTYNQQPTFRWYVKKSVSAYRFQISANQSFPSTIVSVPLADTFYTPSVNLAFGTIFWRVTNDADTSSWSTVSSLTIQDTAIPILIPYAPDPTRIRKPTLTWHHVTGATSYTVQINSTPSFVSPFISDGASDTLYTPGANLPVGSIFWHVKSNLKDQYSSPDTFVVLNDSAPLLIPVTPDTQYVRKPILRWHPGTGGTSYRIQVDTIGNFANPYISLPLSDTVDTPSVDLPYGKICWRVSANSSPTLWSQTDTFWILNASSVLSRASRATGTWLSLTSGMQGRCISIGYNLDRPGNLTLQIFSTSGQCISTLWNGACSEGAHTLQWQARDDRGNPFPNGGYIIACRLNGRLSSTKCILLAR
jgi:Concanavalin A-like lectin/glucanases superfamily/FlgD Ig-like domain